MIKTILLIVISLTFCTGLFAQDLIEKPNDYLVIKLVTIDPGDDLPMWWGHTGIIIEDTRIGAASFYNYGLFSFEQDNFALNFIQGRLIFWVGVWDAQLALNFYARMNRTIRIQTLNLSADKKLEMAKFLAKNVLPQNREYLYDHYFDNCATRLRDLIDKMVDGQFAKATKVTGRMTLRELTRLHTHRSYFMDWLLMFLMNDSIDKPIRKWDEMFLPTELERNVAEFSYLDGEGEIRDMVEQSTTYFEAVDVYIVPEEPPVHWPGGLIVGILISMVLIISAIGYQRKNRVGKVIFSLITILFGVIIGIPGLALFLISLFTDHLVTYGNENLFLSNPLTIIYIIIGFNLLRSKKEISHWMKIVTIVLSGLAVLLVALKILPAFDQNNLLSICLILPVLLSFTFIWLKILPLKSGK